jgi:hypothetical protein
MIDANRILAGRRRAGPFFRPQFVDADCPAAPLILLTVFKIDCISLLRFDLH